MVVEVRQFKHVTTAEGFGVASSDGFTIYDTAREMIRAVARGGVEFSMCQIEGEQVAVFMTVPKEERATLAACKSDSIAAVVFASVSDPYAAIIDAELGAGAKQAVERWAFAAAAVAFSSGSFKVDHRVYIVRGLDRADIEVRLERDDDSESWCGEAKLLTA